MEKNDESSSTATPRLRFPEFLKTTEWEPTTIGALGSFYYGKSAPKWSLSEDAPTPCVRYGELYTKFGPIISETFSRTNSPPDTLRFSKGGEILVPRVGEKAADFGKHCCYLPLKGVAIGEMISVFETKEQPLFYTYYFRHLHRKFAEVVEGQNVKNLYYVELEPLTIHRPSLAEQQKVADCLTSLDEVIAVQDRKVGALADRKHGLMQQLFPREGAICPRLRFPEFSKTGDWRVKRLDDLARRGTGHTPNKARPEYYNGGIRWVSLADSKRLDRGLISDTAIDISPEGIRKSSAVLHPAGTVILSRDAGVGKSAVTATRMAVSQHFIAWITKEDELSNWFLYYTLQTLKPTFERAATGSTIKTIGMPFFKEMRVTVPSLDEQQRIADCLSAIDLLLETESAYLDALKTHKSGLMQQLFPFI